MTDGKQHPIQVVVRRTGLTADVLRAWERRYAAVEPQRSPTQRRLYSDADIERLRLLKRATDAGRSIGQIASLSTDELAAMVREDEAQEAEAPRVQAAAERSDSIQYVDAAMKAVLELDAQAVDSVLQRAVIGLSELEFVEQVVSPLLNQVGDAWHAGELTVAHERAASLPARGVLESMLATATDREGAPPIVVATPVGERHELGAMMVAATAAAAGWRVAYLGPDIPADDILVAVEKFTPRLVALSVVGAGSSEHLNAEVATLRRRLPKDVTLLLGGGGLAGEPESEGVVYLSDLSALRELLRKAAD